MRVLIILAATAVASSFALPALAGDRASDPDAAFVSCLRSHGADIPAETRGAAIKNWLIAHPSAESAAADCKPNAGPAPAELVACLRAQGLQPPSAAEELKPWLGRLMESGDAKEALRACDFAGKEKQATGDCSEQPRAVEPVAKNQ
jgi:hypothetical protein